MAIDPRPSPEPSRDLVPLDELALRLGLSRKTIKRLHREEGLPLVRFTPGSPFFALWSSVEEWAKQRERK